MFGIMRLTLFASTEDCLKKKSSKLFINIYVFLDFQTLYNKYSFKSFGRGKAFTPFLVMCCRIAALQADCKLGTGNNFIKINVS